MQCGLMLIFILDAMAMFNVFLSLSYMFFNVCKIYISNKCSSKQTSKNLILPVSISFPLSSLSCFFCFVLSMPSRLRSLMSDSVWAESNVFLEWLAGTCEGCLSANKGISSSFQ